MRISHQESGMLYEITDQQESVKLVDSHTGKSHVFKESYEAIWFAIELIRNASFETLTEHDLQEVATRSHISLPALNKSFINLLRREKISHMYYDQIFMKLLTYSRTGHETFVLSNKTNFIVYHELVHLLRASFGSQVKVPVMQLNH